MYTHILCAIDGSDLSNKALKQGLALAGKLGAKMTVVTVTDPSVIIAPGAEIMMVDTSSIISDLDEAKATGAKATLDEARLAAEAVGVDITALHVPNSTPADGIIHAAKMNGVDLIVMGSHGRHGIGQLLLGSQAADIISRSEIPVLIVK